ncbi:MAG: PAS domain S-box protein [Leptolyngbya sp. SIO1D8]|nr:PAS domain S-box protein [Leptolyngbya sp. SIO1D8]
MSAANQRALSSLSIDQVLDFQPLIVSPDTTVDNVIKQMGQTMGKVVGASEVELSSSRSEPNSHFNYALVIAENQLLGIFTARDLVRLVAADISLETVAISAVMTQPVIALKRSKTHSLFTVLTTLKQHQIRQLPLVDEAGAVLGVVTHTSIRQVLEPFNFLRLRRVGEVMTRDVVQADVTENLLALAQKLTQHRVSCVVIVEVKRQRDVLREVPIGIVTERDLVQFRALGLSLPQTLARTVMSTPLFLVNPQDTLWIAHQEMQRRHTRRLVVANEAGGLAGIITQTSLLQILDPIEMLTDIEQLQQLNDAQTVHLNETNQQLQQANQALQVEIAERQRLEVILQNANQVLEERVGLQAAQIVQTDEALQQEVQERRQLQAQLERFFADTPSLLCIAGLDGYFKRLNPSFGEILGYSTAELLDIPFLNFVHPDDWPATQAEIERLMAGELTIAFENRYRCRDGSYRWFTWNATASFEDQVIYAVAQDITERKALEKDLKQERNFISAVLDTVGALVTVLEQTGKVISFNKACEQVSGYSANEILGQLIWDVLIPPEEKVVVQNIFRQLKQGNAPNCYENHWLCRDGRRCRISWSNTVLEGANGIVEYVIGTGIDVTDQRQTEQNLARQYQQRQLLGDITRKIRESLKIEDILETAVTEVRKLLACDRVVIIELDINGTGRVIQESMRPKGTFASLLNQVVSGLKFVSSTPINPPHACTCEDLQSAPCSLYTSEFLKQWNVQSCIEIAIRVGSQIWGVITASQCDRPRQWETFEIELMHQLADQMGVAIAQARLLDNLETKVKQRTHQLSQTNQQMRQEIRERIQIENTLRESQQKLAGILDNADEAIISIDSQQRIVMYNRGAERIFGYTFDEVYRQHLDILLPEGFRQIHRQHVRKFATSPDSSRQMANRRRDVFGRRKHGKEFPAEASISKLQTKTGQLFTVILKDITEQRQSEAALRRSEERLRLTTNALPVLICYVDTEQRYCFNNQTYEDWFRIPVDQLQGSYLWQVMDEAYYTQVQPHIETALSGQEVNFEVEVTTPDGQLRYLLTTYIPEVSEQGEVTGFFGLTNDISDRKATERMKDEFVSVVGHELRTPLTSIHGSLRLLASKKLGTLTPQGQEFLEISLKNTQRLTRLINDVLDLERIESGRVTMSMRPFQFSDLMEQAVDVMQAMADAQNIQLIATPLAVTVRLDPDHIIQVLTNLLSNAIKFSATGTTVWLSAIQQNGEILVRVKDQGRGIPPDKLETVFERFQQVDASDSRQLGGTGLGLAICKNIVQRHGGRIWTESTLGAGSTFSFTLPDVQ